MGAVCPPLRLLGMEGCPHHGENVKDEPKPEATQGKAEGAGTRAGV